MRKSVAFKLEDKEIKFFIFTFLLSSILDLIGFTLFESFFKAFFIGLHHFVICYVLTLLLSLIPDCLKKIYKALVFILLFANFLIDIVCIYSFHFTFDREVPAILMGTNVNEAFEFIHTFVPMTLIFLIIFSILLFYWLYNWLEKKIVHFGWKFHVVLLLIVLLGLISFAFVSWDNFGNVSVTKIATFLKSSKTPDLKNYMLNPNVRFIKKHKPRNIVMIIGESFSKSHSSLYGYEKQTNPLLYSLYKTNLLFKYNNVHSPALTTIPAFQSVMSTYRLEYKDRVNWYECLTLQEVLKKSGYYTCWISNQSEKGFHDNIISKYAYLCDKHVFSGNRFAAMGKKDLDEILVDSVAKYKMSIKNTDYCFYFIHLMGSHTDFKNRYSSAFAYFQENDYLYCKQSQRGQLAHYDNSILYNDSVVYEIMNLFSKDEAIVFYFPDHGLDVYDSRDDYVGHARYNDDKSVNAGRNIPFFIYITPLYQKKFTDEYQKLIKNTDVEYCTDNMIYTIMDIIGITIPDMSNSSYKSLLE